MRYLIPALLLALCAAPLLADIGPKPRKTGPGMVPHTDMKDIPVEMTSEEVVLVLGQGEGGGDYLDVTVTFHMTNLGEDTKFEIGFPVGTHKNMTNFSCVTDDVEREVKLIDKNPQPEDQADEGPMRGMWAHDYWYVWEESYAKGAEVTHVVKYRVSIWHFSEYRGTGYILHTGAAWKNVIKSAKVTLTCEDGLSLGNVRRVGPEGFKRDGDSIVWEFKDLEPTGKDDISISYNSKETFAERDARLVKESERFWRCRKELADLRETAPLRFGAEDYTEAELTAWGEALAALIAEAEEVDGKLVMPEEEPEYIHWGDVEMPEELRKAMEEQIGNVKRAYAKEGEAYVLLDSFEDVLKVYKAAPDNKSSQKLLQDWLKVMQAWEDGKLYAGSSKLSNSKEGRAERWAKELKDARALADELAEKQPVE